MTTDGSTGSTDGSWVAGADACRDGWAVVLWHPAAGTVRRRTVASVDALLSLPQSPAVLGVDMVIGCPDVAVPGGRACDRHARQLLGHPRGASVFSPPARDALSAETYEEAVRRNRATGPDAPGLSKQSFYLVPKIRTLADCMTPTRQDRIREVHPELAFYAMNGDAPVDASKHTAAGRRARVDLLAAHGFPDVEAAMDEWTGGAPDADDVLDAHAACWTARRIRDGTAERCPPRDEEVPRNARGLRMEIWR
jgi:predicted RNase H-like nuclease